MMHGSLGQLFGIFLRLGLTSFGGPVAHVGYFRQEFVTRRAWFDDNAFADLVALCQFLPGPGCGHRRSAGVEGMTSLKDPLQQGRLGDS